MVEPRPQAPLAVVHDAVLEFLHGRDDAALFGAQAVNAYADEARVTQDVDILSPRAAALAEEIRAHLNDRFKIAATVREMRDGLGYRIFQIQKPKNRHLVGVRPVEAFPLTQQIEGVRVISPDELIANKVIAILRRKGQPKAGTDWRDVAVLLLRFPELKKGSGRFASGGCGGRRRGGAGGVGANRGAGHSRARRRRRV